MKLIINIPCYNEENTLPSVLKEIPKNIEGINKIEVQVIDDGSTDKTSEIAKKYGCRVIRHKENLGLGIAFKNGVESALKNSADIMVNTDADNQYPSRYMKNLIKPILDNEADIVIGDRQTWHVKHFSYIKKIFQWMGSLTVRFITRSNIPDTVSGFRAYSRESLLRLNIHTRFSYVLDTIVQSVNKDIKMESIPISVNPPTRKSRLFNNMFEHIFKSALALAEVYIIYKPFFTFLIFSFFFSFLSFLLWIRYGYYYFKIGGVGHVQSLIAASILSLSGISLFVLGIIGNLLKNNRELVEDLLYLKKKDFYKASQLPSNLEVETRISSNSETEISFLNNQINLENEKRY